jgi:hypothetical protein
MLKEASKISGVRFFERNTGLKINTLKIKDIQNVESPPASKPLIAAEMFRLCLKLYFRTQLNRRMMFSITDRWIKTFRYGQHCKAIY